MGSEYRRHTRKRLAILAIAVILLAAAFFFNLLSGSSGISPETLCRTVLDPVEATARTRAIVWDMRMPITAMGVLVGASLGSAGAVMQTILNNPLASPYTLGVSAGASVGASLVMVL